MAKQAGGRSERQRDDFDLERLTESMLDLAWLLLGVAVAGIVICVGVRLARLRWSWALVPLPGAALAFLISPLHGALGAGSLMLGAGLGYGRERQDLERGGTDAQRARERRGPISSAVAVVRRSRMHSSRVRDGRFVLGERPSGAIHTVPFGQRQGTRAFIVGAPGSGKTVTLAAHATAYAGEVLPLRRDDFDGETLAVRRTAHDGLVQDGTKTDHGRPGAGRVVPCPPGLVRLLTQLPPRIDTELLFPTPRGKLWRERNFYRDVWQPTREASGIDIRPHDMRHSYLSQLRAAGIDDADLAEIAGHRMETMISHYVHPLRESFESVRRAIG